MSLDDRDRPSVRINRVFRSAAQVEDVFYQINGTEVKISGNNKNEFLYNLNYRGDHDLAMFEAETRCGGTGLYSFTDERIGITVANRGRGRLMTERDDFDICKNYGLIFQTTHLRGYDISEMARTVTVLIPRADFDELVHRHLERECPVTLSSLYQFPLDSRLGHLFGMVSFLLVENHSSEPGCVYSATSIKLIKEALSVTIAEFTQSELAEAPAANTISVSEAHVRRAVDIIKTQTSPLTIHDVAEAVGIGVRALQSGFRTYLGMPPHFLLRQGRIDGARRDLESGTSPTIAAVARKWGFSNVGRFAGEYFKVVGEYPSDTVRRCQK